MLDDDLRHIGELLHPLDVPHWRAYERRLEPVILRASERRRSSLGSIPAFDVRGQTREGTHVRMLRVDGEHYHGEDTEPGELERLDDGQTLHCDRLARVHPSLLDWEAASERLLGVPPGAVMVKLSRSGARAGFPWHFDPADVIVAQIRGRKRWWLGEGSNVWQPPEGCSVVHTSELMRRLVGDYEIPKRHRELVLEPGDVLYLPRGMHHRTESIGPCESLSIRLRPPMWMEVLEAVYPRARDELLERACWRRRSYGAWHFLWGDQGHASAVEELQELLDRDFAGAGLEASAVLQRWSIDFEIAERGGAVRRDRERSSR